jgi:hypothetical protein
MSLARRTVEEYTKLLSRAFNGAIEVDGQRIVAHPSGTLLARAPRNAAPVAPLAIVWQAPAISDRDNDWSDV